VHHDPAVERLVQRLEHDPEKLAAVIRFVEGEPLPEGQGSAPSGGPAPLAQGQTPAVVLTATLVGDPAAHRFSLHCAPPGEPAQPPAAQSAEWEAAARSDAAKVLQLLHAMDESWRCRKAHAGAVFALRFEKSLSYSEIAHDCHCSRGLVARRLKQIQAKLPWAPRRLGEISSYVEAMDAALRDSRARSIYRKGAVYGEEQDAEDQE
jgi:hypothetical protein